jgi:4'-phosphopantetheinyl transferase
MRAISILQKVGNSVSWLPSPELLMLKNNEVHVWRASLEVRASLAKTLNQILSDDELSRAKRFHFQKDRDHYIIARGLLRTILGKYLRMKPEELRFCYGPFGKPSLEEKIGDTLRFNASRSHGLALFAFSLHRDMGVDLEYIRSGFSFENIAGQFFAQRETDALNSLPEHLRQEAFYTLWTRKEAYLKAQGLGLSADMNQYDVLTGAGCPEQISKVDASSGEKSPWVLMHLAVSPGYASAVAVKGQDLHFKYWQWQNAKRLE